jgi:hypothetical protein
MSLVAFQDRTFLDYKGRWFLWEPSWESFRPIDALQWDGTSFLINDRTYCKDPTDALYGYGTPQMKDVCDRLVSFHERSSLAVETPIIGQPEWFRDRYVALHPCAPRDKDSWKRMCRGRVHTCRRPVARNKFTRRNLRHS